MTLLFFDGLDHGVTMPKSEWSGAAWVNRAGRTGVANTGATLPGGNQTKVLTLPTAAATLINGFAFTLVNTYAFDGAPAIWQARISATVHLSLHMDSLGHLLMRKTSSAGAILATSTSAFAIGDWVHLQIKALVHLTAGSFEVKVNGVTEMTFSGSTGTATGAVTAVSLTNVSATGVPIPYGYDDFWVCDAVNATATQGRPNNDFLGDLKAVTLVPTGAGDTTAWTPSTGANWSCVDELPPNQTDFVTATASSTRDLYTMSDLPSNAIDVYSLRSSIYAQKSDAGAASVVPVRKSGGTVTTDTAIPLLTSWGPLFAAPSSLGPGSAVWTAAQVNALQVGVEVA
jgi:hypothetical protein